MRALLCIAIAGFRNGRLLCNYMHGIGRSYFEGDKTTAAWFTVRFQDAEYSVDNSLFLL